MKIQDIISLLREASDLSCSCQRRDEIGSLFFKAGIESPYVPNERVYALDKFFLSRSTESPSTLIGLVQNYVGVCADRDVSGRTDWALFDRLMEE